MRSATISRKTNETEVTVSVALSGGMADVGGSVRDCADVGSVRDCADVSAGRIDTPCGFLNHMLTLFSFHGGFSLNVTARGDTDVDYHHLTEDVGIALGQCIKDAVGDGRGVARYASQFLPMDEALILVALDISGRAHLNYDVPITAQKVGDFDTELVGEFLSGLCRSLGLTLHVKLFYGVNAHHVIEAVFKGLGRALGKATAIDASRGGVPSSKGSLFS